MILFIFEGDDREPFLYKTIERLYFAKGNDNIIYSFGNNIYELYKELNEYDDAGDIFSLLKDRLIAPEYSKFHRLRRTDISEIFLFFDYDFHHSHLTLEEINRRIEEMLMMFDDETENGKLYINYPMVESIRYTKALPDADFIKYAVSRDECKNFKRLAHEFSYYDSFDHILFKDSEKPTKERYLSIKENWEYLKIMNVNKANWLVSGRDSAPENKEDINQVAIFKSQKIKFVDPYERVSVLNAFPIFIFDYLK